MLEALKKRAAHAKSAQPMIEIEIGANDDKKEGEDPAGPAPFRQHDISMDQMDNPHDPMAEKMASINKEHEGMPQDGIDHMAILSALADHKGGGSKLSSMAAEKAKSKMSEYKK